MPIKVQQLIKTASQFILSLISVYAVNEYLFGFSVVEFKNGIFSVFLFITIYLFGRSVSQLKTYLRIHKLSLFSAAFLSIVITIGHSIYHHDTILPIIGSLPEFIGSLTTVVGMSYLLYLIIGNFLIWFDSLIQQKENHREYRLFSGNMLSFLIWWAVILLCWVPVWLAYYPGAFSYDTIKQIEYFDDFHTIIHTFFVRLCHDIGGNYHRGIILYSVSQMGIMSGIFSYILFSLAKLKLPILIRMIALITFALSPFNALFSFIPTKNVLFGGVLLLCTVAFMELASDPSAFLRSKVKMLKMSCFLLLFIILAKNGIYAIVLVTIISLFIFHKHWKRFTITFIPAILLGWFFMSPFSNMMGWSHYAPQEALSVPCQQLAYVATLHWDQLSVEERNTFDQLFPIDITDSYNPRFADPIKNSLNIEEMESFWNLWFSLLPRYPIEYSEAFLTLNLPFWYLDAAYPDRHSNRLYIEEYIYRQLEVKRWSRIPWLFEPYHRFANNESIWQRLPLFSTLTSIGLPFYVLFFTLLIMILKKKGGYAAALLPSVALWLTNIAGPVSNVRYIYPFIAAYPLYLAVVVMVVPTKNSYP